MTSREAEKRAGKIVSYSGKERCDLVYALGTLTHATHKSVLYIDNSIFHDLYAVFAGNNDTDEVLDFGDVVVAKDRKIPERDMRKFDLCILYSGLNTDQSVFYQKADEYIIAPGEEAEEVARMKKAADEIRKTWSVDAFTLIQRDKTGRKQTLGTIAEKIGVRPKRSYVLKFSEENYSAYTALTINKNGGLRGISEEMKLLAVELITIYLNESEKRIRSFLKKM